MAGVLDVISEMLPLEVDGDCGRDWLSEPDAFCSWNAPVLIAWESQLIMKFRFASKAATEIPISSSSLRIVRHLTLSSVFRLSTV